MYYANENRQYCTSEKPFPTSRKQLVLTNSLYASIFNVNQKKLFQI